MAKCEAKAGVTEWKDGSGSVAGKSGSRRRAGTEAEVGVAEERKRRVASWWGAVGGSGEEAGWIQREVESETHAFEGVFKAGLM
jgi:hypothetical protein